MKHALHSLFSLGFLLTFDAQAIALGSEDRFMISNGQGISSPSFRNGIAGQNPAGMVFNQSSKLQIGAGSYYEGSQIGKATSTSGGMFGYGSAAVLLGNGLLGAGLEFQNFINYFKDGSPQGMINWGLGGHLQSLNTSFGLSSHTLLNSAGTTFDLGMFTEVIPHIRLALMIPDFTNGFKTLSGGATYILNEKIEIVVDADYNSTLSIGTLKPGVSFHSDFIHATAAYGLRYLGNGTALLYEGLTAGLGIRVFYPLLFTYEYRGIPLHLAGLTLRFN
jgi:hypothetical protein